MSDEIITPEEIQRERDNRLIRAYNFGRRIDLYVLQTFLNKGKNINVTANALCLPPEELSSLIRDISEGERLNGA